MPPSSSPPSPAWTISSSSSTDSSPSTPTRSIHTPVRTAFTSPPLSPTTRPQRHPRYLTAPRPRHLVRSAAAAYPRVNTPSVRTDDQQDLCRKLNRILDFSDGDNVISSLKGAARWLESGKFERIRDKSAKRLLTFFDDQVLSGALLTSKPGATPLVTVTWSNRLYKTAGLTYMKRRASTGERTSTIQLSTKVVDEPARLYNTLAHEMCHAATWIIDDCAKPPHGAVFKSWASKFAKWDPTLRITTCHDYAIRYKYNYECLSCGQNYGRHSRSINTNKQVCGRCRGSLTLLC